MTGIEYVDDPEDSRLAVFLDLRDHGDRQRRERPGGDMAGWFMAEGRLVVDRAVASGHILQCLLVDARGAETEWLEALGTDVYLAGPSVLTTVSGRPRLKDPIGCFARREPVELAALIARSQTVAVLEGVTNPTNMGMIIRNAAGLGIDAVLVDSASCDPLYRRSVRVSMGQVFAISHARVPTVVGLMSQLAEAEFDAVALTPDPDAMEIGRYERDTGRRVAVLLGTEAHGLSDETLAAASHRVRIPMAAGVDSLNVAAASAIAFHELRR